MSPESVIDPRNTEAPQRNTETSLTTADAPHPLFSDHDDAELRRRRTDVQAAFVDAPRRAVEQADALVADVMKRLTDGFAAERHDLEQQWDRGENVTTEDLRVVLQRYRAFFGRLLTI